MNHNYVATFENVTLRPLRESDIEKIRCWRNNSENTKFLSNIGEITPEQQKCWFDKYLPDDTEVIFAIVENTIAKEIVGSVSLYEIHDNTAEVGRILIGDSRVHGKGIGRKALVMAMAIGFKKMGLTRIVGSVSPDNVQAYTNDMRIGFKIVGEHVLDNGILEKELKINYEDLKISNAYVEDILFCQNGSRFYVGQEGAFSKKITDEDIHKFADATGDVNPIHLEDKYASKSRFGKRICHGMLTGSLISACIGTVFPGEGAIYLAQNLQFRKPVMIGDYCTATVIVRFINNEKNILLLDTVVTNEAGEEVVTGDAKVLVDSI